MGKLSNGKLYEFETEKKTNSKKKRNRTADESENFRDENNTERQTDFMTNDKANLKNALVES
jgi:hypothetical protein